jgi:hypothetical protein
MFDSYPEMKFATLTDKSLMLEATAGKPFWIRNQRNIHFDYGSRKYYPDFLVYDKGDMHIVEIKGEKYDNPMKRYLLKKLDEIKMEGDISHYHGHIVFGRFFERTDINSVTCLEDFLTRSGEYVDHQQDDVELIATPPETEKYIKYLPVYTPEDAHKKFILNQKTPKPSGWLNVPENTNKFPENVFATQVKGNALLGSYEHNQWILLQTVANDKEAVDKVSLVYNQSITDDYEPGYTIRMVRIVETPSEINIFPDTDIHLESTDSSNKSIIIKDIVTKNKVIIIGVEYED